MMNVSRRSESTTDVSTMPAKLSSGGVCTKYVSDCLIIQEAFEPSRKKNKNALYTYKTKGYSLVFFIAVDTVARHTGVIYVEA